MDKSQKSKNTQHKREIADNGNKINAKPDISSMKMAEDKSEVKSENYTYASFGKPAMVHRSTKGKQYNILKVSLIKTMMLDEITTELKIARCDFFIDFNNFIQILTRELNDHE